MTSERIGLTQLYFDSIKRHFVSLSCVQKRGDQEVVLVFSGFMAEIAGFWVYVTAGHVIRWISDAVEQGSNFDIWRLGDLTSKGRFRNWGIPYSLLLDRWIVIENEDLGLDYAAVILEELYCLNLRASGVQPLQPITWGDHIQNRENWALIGIPNETIQYDGETNINARVVLLPLDPAETPDEAGERSQNQFYGQLRDDSLEKVRDLKGLSGGPIFSLAKVEDEWKYWVIGVQSAWYRSKRVITACPFSSFGDALEEAFSEAIASLSGDATDSPGAA